MKQVRTAVRPTVRDSNLVAQIISLHSLSFTRRIVQRLGAAQNTELMSPGSSSKPLRVFNPSRTFHLQGFTGRGATTTLHDASATLVSLSGIFQAAEDFAVLGLCNAYDYFNHLRLKHLPRIDLLGLTLNFNIESNHRPVALRSQRDRRVGSQCRELGVAHAIRLVSGRPRTTSSRTSQTVINNEPNASGARKMVRARGS